MPLKIGDFGGHDKIKPAELRSHRWFGRENVASRIRALTHRARMNQAGRDESEYIGTIYKNGLEGVPWDGNRNVDAGRARGLCRVSRALRAVANHGAARPGQANLELAFRHRLAGRPRTHTRIARPLQRPYDRSLDGDV